MTRDPRWHDNAARGKNRASLIERLQEIFLTRTYEEWEAILVPAGIPMGAINTIDTIVSHPQVAARKVLVECEHPTAGTTKVVGPAVRLSETPGAIRTPAPRLGEHTDAVLRERLGMDDAAVERLRKDGVIGGRR
jgi:CoA:oxalate CoA-transferase